MEIVTYRYRNRDIHLAVYTHRVHLDEIVAYLLGERLMSGIAWEGYDDVSMIGYLQACLDPLDQPLVLPLYDEIKKRVEEISSDIVFQSLIENGETYLKCEYILGRKHTRLNIFTDSADTAWLQW